MKICWWTVYPNTHHTALLEALRARGVDVEACYFHGGYDRRRLGMGWRDPELKSWEHRARTLAEARAAVPDFDSRVQMVPSFFNLTSWKVALSASFSGMRWFAMTEGTRGRWFMRPLFRLFAAFANRAAVAVFALGSRAAGQFRAAGVAAEKVVRFAYATRPVPDALPPKADRLTFVFAGEFCARKAVDVIAAAWRKVSAEFPEARLLVAGDGAMRGAFAGLAGVEHAGAVRQEDVYGVIARGHVILLPSRYDAWGAALAEGAAAGLAMIGSDATGAAVDLVRDGENGFLVKAGDVDALAAAMRRYAADPALAARHGAAARTAARATDGGVLADAMIERLFEPNGMDVVDGLLRAHGVMRSDEVWVHGMWTPRVWRQCRSALAAGRRLVRMTHGSLSPVYLERQGKWRKRLVAGIERRLFRRTARVVVTSAAEAAWVAAWLGPAAPEIERLDLKRFFRLDALAAAIPADRPLHVLYLGRRHPLKGVEFLESAVRALAPRAELKIADRVSGAAKEDAWTWCDVLALPSLSENFGLVVAEALERGKRVVVSDGAAAWADERNARLVYLDGFVAASSDERVRMLTAALACFCPSAADKGPQVG